MKTYLLKFNLILLILGLFLVFSPAPTYAKGWIEGFVKDPNSGQGLNNIPVRLINTREFCDAEGENCEIKDRTIDDITTNHPENGRPGYFTFKDRDDDGEGRLWCRSTAKIYIKMPNSSEFIPLPEVINNREEATNTIPSSVVLGISSQLSQRFPNPPDPKDVPSNCQVIKGNNPIVVVGNVVRDGTYYELVCDPSPKPSDPPPLKCEGKCDWTKPDTGCPTSAGDNKSCSCVRQDNDDNNNEGKCMPCPDGTTYDSNTKKCEPPPPPPPPRCEGKCDWTKPDTGCPASAGDNQSCYCVRQDTNNSNTEGKCMPCPTGTNYNSDTKKCEPPPAPKCAGACDTTKPVTGCPAAAGDENGCFCVLQDNATTTGVCQGCPTGYNPKTKKCVSALCDTISVSPTQFTPGQEITVTSFFKIEGDLTKAKPNPITFQLLEFAPDNVSSTEIAKFVDSAISVVESSTDKVRYRGTWKLKLPTTLKKNTRYLIKASSSITGVNTNATNTNKTVLGLITEAQAQTQTDQPTNTRPANPLQAFIDWLASLTSRSNTVATTPESDPDELQLTTLGIGKITGGDKCSSIEFTLK